MGATVLILGLTRLWKYDLPQKGKKIILEVAHLAGVSKSMFIPATQIREVGAGQEQMGILLLYMLGD